MSKLSWDDVRVGDWVRWTWRGDDRNGVVTRMPDAQGEFGTARHFGDFKDCELTGHVPQIRTAVGGGELLAALSELEAERRRHRATIQCFEDFKRSIRKMCE